MIPDGIKREHILKAIEEIKRSEIPTQRDSTKYNLEYDNKLYPPKYVISLANKYANGTELDHEVFGGGPESNTFLSSLGFNIVNKETSNMNIPKSNNPLSFIDLQRFLLEKMRMQANYQPIMIKTLLVSGGKATKDNISAGIKELNPQKPEEDFLDIPVYDVLEKHGIVKRESTSEFVLNVEELTSGQVSQLIALCNWKILDQPLQLEELINAFDKNKSLFNPDRPTFEEMEKLRLSFISDFPVDKILEIKLNDYVAGKRDSMSDQVDKTTFCYRLERELGLGGISGVVAQKFGIYFDQENQNYDYNKEKYDSPEKAFDTIKSEIYTILQAGKQIKEDNNWNHLSEVLERDYNIYRLVRSKILSVYYPEEFIQIHSIQKLQVILNAFGKSTSDIKDKLFLLQARLLEVKNQHHIMKQWHNVDFSHFVWQIVFERKAGESDEEYNIQRRNTDNRLSFWIVRAGSKGSEEKDALEKNVVTIHWNQLPDLSSIRDKQSLKQLYLKSYNVTNDEKMAAANMIGSVWRFIGKIKERDLIFLPLQSEGSKTIAIGKVEGDYRYMELTPEIKHIRPVKWLVKNILESEFDGDVIKKFNLPMTVYEIKGSDTIERIKKVLNRYGLSDIDMDGLTHIEAELKKGTESTITLEDVSRQTYFSIDTIKEVEILLHEKKQIILYGPPGTSKTFFAKIFARYFTGNPENIALIQFHPSYSYEDFIEGIKPNLSETGQANGFSRQDGFFKKLVNKCNIDPNNKYVLIIDEINRGNIAKIFGELIYLLEYRKEKVVLTYSPNESFSIPSNLYLIGTMNSADRSIAFVDYALRRRFYFKNFYPNSNVNLLREWFEDHPPNRVDSENVIHMFEEINKVIVERLGREYQIGHSYLMKKDLDNDALRRIIDYAIMPLLEQYFFSKKERIEEFKEIFNRAIMPV